MSINTLGTANIIKYTSQLMNGCGKAKWHAQKLTTLTNRLSLENPDSGDPSVAHRSHKVCNEKPCAP